MLCISYYFGRKSFFEILGLLGCVNLCSCWAVSVQGPVAVSSFEVAESESGQGKTDNQGYSKTSASLSDFEGLYVGLGFSWQNFKRKVTVSDNDLSIRDPDGALEAPGADKKNALLLDKCKGAFGGSVVAGYGWQMGKYLHIAAECSVDFAGSRKSDQEVDHGYDDEEADDGYAEDVWESNVRTTAVVPTFGVRVGAVVPQMDCLFYLKGGVSYLRNEFSSSELIDKNEKRENYKISKVVPVIGVGLEKKFYTCSKGSLSVRLDYEHRFETKKSHKYVEPDGLGYVAYPTSKVRGDIARLLLVYRCSSGN